MEHQTWLGLNSGSATFWWCQLEQVVQFLWSFPFRSFQRMKVTMMMVMVMTTTMTKGIISKGSVVLFSFLDLELC